jgi:hypothetical protein
VSLAEELVAKYVHRSAESSMLSKQPVAVCCQGLAQWGNYNPVRQFKKKVDKGEPEHPFLPLVEITQPMGPPFDWLFTLPAGSCMSLTVLFWETEQSFFP